MNISQLLKEVFKYFLLILIVSFFTFSKYRLDIGIKISFFLNLFRVPDNICGWIGFYGFTIMIISVTSGFILKSYKSWLLSIPGQFFAYSICWCIVYGTFDFVKCAILVGEIWIIQAVVIGMKLIAQMLITCKKNRIRTLD